MTRPNRKAKPMDDCVVLPFDSGPCCANHGRWGCESQDVAETQLALRRAREFEGVEMTADGFRAFAHKVASVAGCHPDDARAFLLDDCSLTVAVRARMRTWAREAS